MPNDVDKYATDYLWNEVLLPDNLLNILARYVHLQIEEVEDWQGKKSKKETLIFPAITNGMWSAACSSRHGKKGPAINT